jgi:hypothetical protein
VAIFYAFSEDGETWGDWSEEIPTAKNAGTYYAKWYVQGNKNYKDWPESVPIEVPFERLSKTITANAVNWEYHKPVDGLVLTTDNTNQEISIPAEDLFVVDEDGAEIDPATADPGMYFIAWDQDDIDNENPNYKLTLKKVRTVTLRLRNNS